LAFSDEECRHVVESVVLSLLLSFFFALCERKKETQKKSMEQAAAG
jgi:hypothetical protein